MSNSTFVIPILTAESVLANFKARDPEKREAVCEEPGSCILALVFLDALPNVGHVSVSPSLQLEYADVTMIDRDEWRRVSRKLTQEENNIARSFDRVTFRDDGLEVTRHPTNADVVAFLEGFVRGEYHA